MGFVVMPPPLINAPGGAVLQIYVFARDEMNFSESAALRSQWDQSKNPNIHAGLPRPLAFRSITLRPGCGDAFRSGFLHGYSRGWDFHDCARLGTVMGSFAIEKHGGQNHEPSMSEIRARYEGEFGKFPDMKPVRPTP